MIHRESWYKEVSGFLAEQDTQGLEEDTWAHPKAPGKYPDYEENHPYADVKGSMKGEDSGGLESDITLEEIRVDYPDTYDALINRFKRDPNELHKIIYDKSFGEEIAGTRLTESLARRLIKHFNARGRVRSGSFPSE